MFKDRETIHRPIDIQTFENIGVASNVTALRLRYRCWAIMFLQPTKRSKLLRPTIDVYVT